MSQILSTWETLEDDLIMELQSLLSQSTEEQRTTLITRCDQAIRTLTEILALGCRVHIRQSLTARLARLESLHLRAKNLHRTGEGLGGDTQTHDLVWKDLFSAFERRIRTGAILNVTFVDPKLFLDAARSIATQKVTESIDEHRCVKVNTTLNAEFLLREDVDVKCFNTANRQLFIDDDLNEWFDAYVTDPILTQMEEFQERDSGWALHRLLNLTVNINRCEPMSASSYIELPGYLSRKKAIVNIRADDDACFAWAVVAAMYPALTNSTSRYAYPCYREVFNWQGLTFPIDLKQIKKFEKLNSISINVFVLEHMKIVPLQLTKHKLEKHVNILMLISGDTSHFCWIKNMSRLISNQLSRHHGQVHVCDRCLHVFHSKFKLQVHTIDCENANECAIELPTPGNNIVQFENYKRRERVPFVVYADFECLLKNLRRHGEDDDDDSGEQDPATLDEENDAATPLPRGAYQKHTAFSVGLYVQCSYDSSLCQYQSYRGESPSAWLVMRLCSLIDQIGHVYRSVAPMEPLSDTETDNFQATSQKCHICNVEFLPEEVRVHDHCHFTGKYRGPAHNACNLNYKVDKIIPVIFHNLMGYDAHFVIKELATLFPGTTSVLPLNKEKYISFSKTIGEFQLRFIDSFKFLSASLDKLVSYLPKDKLQILRAEFQGLTPVQLQLISQKGVFPYDWLDSMDKLSVESLPPREQFYNKLSDSDISIEDYQHAENVWREFDIKTMGEYSDLYLKTDVLLLADVFENFRENCLDHYSLDPAHYYTIPGLAWDAMLRVTGIHLELLTDIDMLLFVERGIRGGLSQASNRHSCANNRYMRDYDASQPSKYLMYFDVNNLYGWAMSEHLPFRNFCWMSTLNFNVTSVADDARFGYFLEVDLEYPQSLHDVHKDLPFCPLNEKPPGSKECKLLATVRGKERYVIHYRNLKQCLAHGLRLTKIHRVLKFEQKRWLCEYIDINTKLRAKSRNDFEKNLFKLMNNAVFGKTMENVRNHMDIRLVTKWEGRYGARALIAKPSFHRHTIFDENFIAIELKKLKIRFNKPIYVGASILDVSKICLYDFHHNYMVKEFEDRVKLMYTDTDSLVYEIQCDDVYDLLKRDAHKFDTSDYPPDNVYGISLLNKKIPGLMKDENNGEIMEEVVALRSKMYAVRLANSSTIKRAKGVKRYAVVRYLTFQDYMTCIRQQSHTICEQNSIRSNKHHVYSITQSKIALSSFDTKRFLIPRSTDTLPWGHYKIPTLP